LLTTFHTQRIVLDVLPHLLDVITPPAGVRALPFITLPAPEQLAIHGELPYVAWFVFSCWFTFGWLVNGKWVGDVCHSLSQKLHCSN
jgi:hypothetical protein